MEKIAEYIRKNTKQVGIGLETNQVEKFVKFYQMVIEENKKVNLTRIVEPMEFAIKHIVDSLLVLKAGIPIGQSGIDIGSGAGFPGIPIAITQPTQRIVLVDSLAKRVRFLDSVKNELDLGKVEVVHARAEDLAHENHYREKFDWVTARAVASLPSLLELCTPFVKVGGVFLAMKGQNVDEEIASAAKVCKLLGVVQEEVFQFKLPEEMGERILILFRKIGATDNKYPRKPNLIKKNPLG
ncbi:MAG: 16S rRNA (guanine(527)-N(7))-methyltransferase RsmG [Firmicutes bacterium]|nr:16S rRNA (guanine(527)-N(7))-methyltransferase RsmG [Bacillota bacterium]